MDAGAAKGDRELVADQLAAPDSPDRQLVVKHARYDWLLLA
jgi:hypothetical protein